MAEGGAGQLTFGEGNDTEAAWSPDGKTIAFQTDRAGDMDICLLDVETGAVQTLVGGPGDACFPAWAPGGQSLVYSFAHFQGSAEQEQRADGWNLFLIPAQGGIPRRLTSGRHRDLTPVFTPDGKRIVFASTRGADKRGRMRLYSLPPAGGEPTLFLNTRGHVDSTWMQPTFSPDGTRFAAGFVNSLRDNWSILTGMTDAPDRTREIASKRKGPLYGPRWTPSPCGLLACTGYEPGDGSWGIYLVHAHGQGTRKITDGPGHSRSAAWSPDGRSLVFENNRNGLYKLYRMAVPIYRLPSPEHDPLALVPHVTASCNTEDAALAFDGNATDNSHWFCVGLDQWIEATYPKPRTLRGVRVHSGFLAYAKNPSGTQSVAGYRLQAWMDGKWQDLIEPVKNLPVYTGETRDMFHTDHAFAPVTTTRLRLLLTASHDTLRRVRSPHTPCVPPEKAATYIREIEVLFDSRTADTASADDWQLVVSENFSTSDAVSEWVLDGTAGVSINDDGQLEINTRKEVVGDVTTRCSVLWYPKPVLGDLRFEFDARGDKKNRCIFFFNARTTGAEKSIFAWRRPRAAYADYAGDDRIELYTLGMLRYDQEEENLRLIGGELAPVLRDMLAAPKGPERKKRNQTFQDKSIFQSHPRATSDPETMAHFVLTVIGAQLTLTVDGKQVFDVIDSARVHAPLAGGHFGFRNFIPGKAWYDNLRVYQRAPSN